MQNAPSGSELDSSSTPRSVETSDSNSMLGKSLALFLIGTGSGPLVLVGKSMQTFGLLPVISFILGAGLVYGYAFVKPLPWVPDRTAFILPAPNPSPEPDEVRIRLHGTVEDSEGQPLKEPFMVGVLLKQLGPLRNSDGSFAIDVPKNTSYDLALWNVGAQRIQVYNGYPAKRDGDGYSVPAMRFYETIREVSAADPRPRARTLQARSSDQRESVARETPSSR
jgi:hypothetical protein